MSKQKTQPGEGRININYENYEQNKDGFRQYLHDLADEAFPFPGYRDRQDEILYETVEAFFIDGVSNVVIEGPTGIGKSPVNVAVSRVIAWLSTVQSRVKQYFDVELSGLDQGNSFYTTPQKSLRNQLAEDDDLRDFVAMLKGRQDYTCVETGQNCADCSVRASTTKSCLEASGCTYWDKKMDAIQTDTAVITFAMLIIDNSLPVTTDTGARLSFSDRDLVIVDEGHNSESQSSSMFAGFTVSPWTIPPDVFEKAGERADWNADRFADVQDILSTVAVNCRQFVERNKDNKNKQSAVDECKNMRRKIKYAMQTHEDGRGWVVNIDQVSKRHGQGMTKSIEVKPVRVDEFLSEFVWSRASRRLITSATIPFRGNVDQWADRLGLDGETRFVSKPTPFSKHHREIYLNTMVGPMDSNNEDDNWPDAMDQIREISSHHQNENGLIHSVSYSRAERVGDSLGRNNVVVDDQDNDSDAMIARWCNSDKDIMVSPRMTEGVDLHGDKCRWQVLLKTPFAYYGDSRVNYLLNEENEWGWYYEKAATDVIQSVGRAVRGPEPEEAAVFYVLDSKFEDVMKRTNPPEYFVEAVEDGPPVHWDFPKAAPWR